MKKYIKTGIIVVIGMLFCLAPINTKAENFVQKSEVVEQTTANKKIEKLLEKNKELTKKYNKHLKVYKGNLNIYYSFNSKKKIKCKCKFNYKTEYVLPMVRLGTACDTKFDNPVLEDLTNINKQLSRDIKKVKKETKVIKQKKQDFLNNQTKNPNWDGAVLSKTKGVAIGPCGKETYYNLNMSGIVKVMRAQGNEDEYWVRKDGCKMLGDYIMVAANLKKYPRGTIVETSLGKGIVCDTGGFVHNGSGVTFDIATEWK